MNSSPDITLALTRERRRAFHSGGRGLPVRADYLFSPRGFPNLSQRAVSAVDRIVIGNWQSRDVVIGFWPLARQTSK